MAVLEKNVGGKNGAGSEGIEQVGTGAVGRGHIAAGGGNAPVVQNDDAQLAEFGVTALENPSEVFATDEFIASDAAIAGSNREIVFDSGQFLADSELITDQGDRQDDHQEPPAEDDWSWPSGMADGDETGGADNNVEGRQPEFFDHLAVSEAVFGGNARTDDIADHNQDEEGKYYQDDLSMSGLFLAVAVVNHFLPPFCWKRTCITQKYNISRCFCQYVCR